MKYMILKSLSHRRVHIWVSVALSLPILLVALTAPFIAHDDALGTKEVILPAAMAGKSEEYTLHAALTDRHGRQWLGTKHGLFEQRADGPRLVAAMDGIEVRSLAETPRGVLAASKQGLWRIGTDGGDNAQRILPGDFRSVTTNAAGRVVVIEKESAWQSADAGATFTRAEGIEALPAALAGQAARRPYMLANLIMDVHTGKVFFGKAWEWIWIDLVGLSLLGLTITGLTVWVRGKRRQQTLQTAESPGA